MFKTKVASDKRVYGVWQRIPSPVISEILAVSGVDFVTIDMEHGAIDVADLRLMVPVFKRFEIPVILRVASSQHQFITKVLDLGVDGIMVPTVNTAAEAAQIVAASKFAPLGKRGVGGPCAADQYGGIEVGEFVSKENDRVLTIVQIENQHGIQNLDEILLVEGIDLFYIGPFDLSQALGVTGQVDHPIVQEAIQSVISKVKATGKPVGMHGVSPEFIKNWSDQGVSYFTYGMDSAFFKQSVRRAFQELR